MLFIQVQETCQLYLINKHVHNLLEKEMMTIWQHEQKTDYEQKQIYKQKCHPSQNDW